MNNNRDGHQNLKLLSTDLNQMHLIGLVNVAVCHMNKNFNQTAGQIAHKSYPSGVVRAADIAMEAYNNSNQFNLDKLLKM